MSKEFQHILHAAMELQQKEQFLLVEALLDKMREAKENNTLENTINSTQLKELDKRMEAFWEYENHFWS